MLGDDPYQYLTLTSLYGKTTQPVERTAVIEAFGQILQHPEFIKAYGSKYIEVKAYIVKLLVNLSKTGDTGNVAIASAILKEPKTGAKGFVTDTLWFETAKSD